ncbi:30S ribosomal protein S16 [Corynebacterium pyruviciproducens]|uniref:Small ribosomal subunit protein bS16 n=2 Tax=Corynebacterium pyruviciproducens TaxID=598660 RepID=S2Z6Q9_9CORY|nr:30S ribosomal protein S16 [Corynebacterium pyruviciproducens]EPD69935.1 30S ribosomal protein S16 [Corynebacterium pyruviciproducens ATCC BAA-1742]MDH4657062.1 30S ribosomal protein S16 [Corynebacterium pyruviciproducens]MDK6566248.1 30S ribosomal protein S16 [Corynebacterium pyruviciproducens]MDK7214431.1 30S ribosomal protein S16 [Corynebacterium pyruviciproducens]WOT03049.1 30S ribosomal protein S16 [Corynebacterium pyruviciproducens]
MAVKIKLARIGRLHNPQYRIVVQDSRGRRNGRVIENLGIYQPKNDPSIIEVNSERAQYWLGVGAQPTEPVLAILKVTGDWQKFKGIEGAEGTLKVAEPKRSKLDIFNEALEEANNGPTAEAITEKKKKAKEEKEAAEAAAKKKAEEEAKAESDAEETTEAPAEEAAEEAKDEEKSE